MKTKFYDKLSANKRVDVINNIIAEMFLDLTFTNVDDKEFLLPDWIEHNDVLPLPYFPNEEELDNEGTEWKVFYQWNVKNEAFRKLLRAMFAPFGVFSDINEPLLVAYYDGERLRYGIWFRQHQMKTRTTGDPNVCEVEIVYFNWDIENNDSNLEENGETE